MKILETEVEFDFYDADQSTKIEEELNKLSIDMKEVKGKTRAGQITDICNLIQSFFETVFGKDVSNKIFQGKKNWNSCFAALDDVFNAKDEADKEMIKKLDARNKKYERYMRG